MARKIAILQSNYIPWKGYFDLINFVDEFILLDDVQYTRSDWRNRNKIKTMTGTIWLTIPVRIKGRHSQSIAETVISSSNWNRKHWNSIVCNYARAGCFDSYKDLFEELFLGAKETLLSQVNYRFISEICKIFNIKTKISRSAEYGCIKDIDRTERVVDLCKKAGASEYLSGPSAKDYIDEGLFAQERIKLSYMDYSEYPEYRQLFPPFEHGVSIIDLILNEGPEATKYMRSFRQ